MVVSFFIVPRVLLRLRIPRAITCVVLEAWTFGAVLELQWRPSLLLALALLTPSTFQVFASRILPFAPKSGFDFLMILALVCASMTRHLGVYILVGAFLVGVTAVILLERLPSLTSERRLNGIELFASLYIP